MSHRERERKKDIEALNCGQEEHKGDRCYCWWLCLFTRGNLHRVNRAKTIQSTRRQCGGSLRRLEQSQQQDRVTKKRTETNKENEDILLIQANVDDDGGGLYLDAPAMSHLVKTSASSLP